MSNMALHHSPESAKHATRGTRFSSTWLSREPRRQRLADLSARERQLHDNRLLARSPTSTRDSLGSRSLGCWNRSIVSAVAPAGGVTISDAFLRVTCSGAPNFPVSIERAFDEGESCRRPRAPCRAVGARRSRRRRRRWTSIHRAGGARRHAAPARRDR